MWECRCFGRWGGGVSQWPCRKLQGRSPSTVPLFCCGCFVCRVAPERPRPWDAPRHGTKMGTASPGPPLQSPLPPPPAWARECVVRPRPDLSEEARRLAPTAAVVPGEDTPQSPPFGLYGPQDRGVAFRQSKIFSGAFGASQFRPKNLFGASHNSGSPAGGGVPPTAPPPLGPPPPQPPPPPPRTPHLP